MGEFHYVDLFATKGIEYIVVIIYLLLLIPFWKFLTKNSDSGSGSHGSYSHHSGSQKNSSSSSH